MFNPKHLIDVATNPQAHIWIETTLVKKTRKAFLVEFDGKQIWLPKAWILRIKRNRGSCAINIKISQYHWGKK